MMFWIDIPSGQLLSLAPDSAINPAGIRPGDQYIPHTPPAAQTANTSQHPPQHTLTPICVETPLREVGLNAPASSTTTHTALWF